MSFSTLRTSALIFAGLSLTSNGADDTFGNVMWTIELDGEVSDVGFLFSGIVSYDRKPLCDDGMTDASATALCRHFELGNYGSFEANQEVGTDDFGADNLVCPDDAMGLGDCHFDTEFEDCDAGEGVRLKCSMWTLQKPAVLEDHEHPFPKHLGMVYYNFKPLCDDNIDRHAADALCRTMNLGKYGEFVPEMETGTDDFNADNLDCPEGAQSIHDCEFLHHEHEDCDSGEGVVLICTDGFRLKYSDRTNEGYVVYRGQAVCEVGDMTSLAANLLCQNIGEGTTGVWETRDITDDDYLSDKGFGADNPSCQRSETHLDQCVYTTDEHLPCNDDRALYLTCTFDGWAMLPASSDIVPHGDDRDHSGFVYYNGKPLCDDYMSNREASMLCHTMHYGDYKDLNLAAFNPGGDWRGTWEMRNVGTDNFGADNLYCPSGSDVQSIDDCTWDTVEDCNSFEGVWLNCHKGWQLEKSVWGGDENKVAGFLTFDDRTVCKESFNDDSANAMCRTWYGPSARGVWQQKVNTSRFIVARHTPTVTLACPSHARTVEECTRGEPVDECDFGDAVHLECIM